MTFEAVYTSRYKNVRRFCLSVLGNIADAEEVTQEAFMVLFKGWDTVEHRDGCMGLLIQQAKWLIANRRKKHSNRFEVPISRDIPYRHKFRDPLPERLLDMIWKLPRLQRRTLVMYYYGDMKLTEIAKAMGTGATTADYRRQAGIKNLRKKLI